MVIQVRASNQLRNVSTAAAAGISAPAAKTKLVRSVDAGTSQLPLPGGSAGFPIIGNTPAFVEKGSLRYGLENHLRYGPVFKTSLYGMELYMVTTMELYKAVMLEDTKLVGFNMGGAFAKLQGEFQMRILRNEGGVRMANRKAFLAALTSEALAGYALKMADIAKAEVDLLLHKGEWPLCQDSRRWAMNFANTLLAGLRVTSEADSKLLRDDLAEFFSGLITYDIDLPGTPLRNALNARERLMARLRGSIALQMGEMTAEKAPAAPGQPKVRSNMLGYIIDHQKSEGMEPSLDDLASIALGVLQAGTDTSSSGFIGLLTMLGQMPHHWQKIREEQEAVVKTHGPAITKASLDASKYLDACVKEALRLNAPGSAQWREALKDFELGPYRIPAGSRLYLNVLTAHALDSDSSWGKGWKEGDAIPPPPLPMDLSKQEQAFRPEKWLDPVMENRPSLLTFGHGPHTCVGMALYILEAKAMVATMVRDYDLKLVNASQTIEWTEMPMMKPTEEVMMSLVPIKH